MNSNQNQQEEYANGGEKDDSNQIQDKSASIAMSDQNEQFDVEDATYRNVQSITPPEFSIVNNKDVTLGTSIPPSIIEENQPSSSLVEVGVKKSILRLPKINTRRQIIPFQIEELELQEQIRNSQNSKHFMRIKSEGGYQTPVIQDIGDDGQITPSIDKTNSRILKNYQQVVPSPYIGGKIIRESNHEDLNNGYQQHTDNNDSEYVGFNMSRDYRSGLSQQVEEDINNELRSRFAADKMLQFETDDEGSVGQFLMEQEALVQYELDQMNYNRSWSNLIRSILNYIFSSMSKNQSSFNIGVFTVFLTVMFLCSTKSLFDTSPIALIKYTQDQVGVFDFQLGSDRREMTINGDIDHYNTLPFEFEPLKKIQVNNLFNELNNLALQDKGDHLEMLGINILNFEVFREKLDSNMHILDAFKGFSPRWILPTKLRRLDDTGRNTSAMAIILDSKREVKLEMAEQFTPEIIGRNEIMVSESLLNYLGIPPNEKLQVEVFFDLLTIIQTMRELSQKEKQYVTKLKYDNIQDQEEQQFKNLVDELMPSVDQLAKLMRDDLNLTVDTNNVLELDVLQLVSDNVNLTGLTWELPIDTDITQYVANVFNLSLLNGLRTSLPESWANDPATETLFELLQGNLDEKIGTSPGELLQGDNIINLDFFVKLINETAPDFAKIKIPLEDVMEAVYDINLFPRGLQHQYTVTHSFNGTGGKVGTMLGSSVLLDCHHINDTFITTFNNFFDGITDPNPFYFVFLKEAKKSIGSLIGQIDFCKYAFNINGELKDKFKAYSGTQEQQKRALVNVGNTLMSVLSQDANVTVQLPIGQALSMASLAVDFMNNNYILIIGFLTILSSLMIYGLMLSDIDTKTFEFGMLRALGFNKSNLAATILFQAFIIGMPALLIGLAFGSGLNASFRWIFYQITQVFSDYELTKESLYLGVSVGVIIPFIANLFPLRKALASNLRASLDIHHRHIGEIQIIMKKFEKVGISMTQTVMAVTLTVFGVLIYVGAPQTFFTQNFNLFFLLMMTVLMLMTIGLVYLFQLVQIVLERSLLVIFMTTICRLDKKLKVLVNKNLESHRRRNSKTALMFTFCLCFITYGGCSFKLLEELINQLIIQTAGSDLVALDPFQQFGMKSSKAYIDEIPVANFLNQQKDFDGSVEGFSFVTPDMRSFLQDMGYTQINITVSESTGSSVLNPYQFAGIDRNYLNVVEKRSVIITEYSKDYENEMKNSNKPMVAVQDTGQIDIVDSMFVNYNTSVLPIQSSDQFDILTQNSKNKVSNEKFIEIKMIIPEGLRFPMSLDTNMKARLTVSYRQLYGTMNYRVKVVGLAQKVTGFLFTAHQYAQYFPTFLISSDQFGDILADFKKYDPSYRERYNDLFLQTKFKDDVPKKALYIKLSPDIDYDRKKFIMNGVKSYLKGDSMRLFDAQELLDVVSTTRLIFELLLAFIAIISFIFTYFFIKVSANQNLSENLWEYAQLRAIGLTKSQAVRLCLYEQYIVIISATILGLLGGAFISSIVTASFYQLTENRFQLLVPFELVGTVVILGLCTTFFAVYAPIRKLNEQKISRVLIGEVKF